MNTPTTTMDMKTTIEILGSAAQYDQRVLLLLRDTAAFDLRTFPDFWEFPLTSGKARAVRDTCQHQIESMELYNDPRGLAPCFI